MLINLDAPGVIDDVKLQAIARAIAQNIDPLPKILAANGLSVEQLERITNIPYFQQLLDQEIKNWNSAKSTKDRIALKSASMIEESLPAMFERIHDRRESLLHKSDILKTLAKFANIGTADGSQAEKVSVTINVSGVQTKVAGITPPVIDNDTGEVLDTSFEVKTDAN